MFRIAAIIFACNYRIILYEYMIIAKNLLQGNGFSLDYTLQGFTQPTSNFTPLYVYGILFFMWICRTNFLLLYLGQALIAASGAIPAYLVGRKMFARRTGVIFALGYLFFPEMIFLSARPVPEFLYVVLFLWMLNFYLDLQGADFPDDKIKKRALRLGILSGILLLTKAAGIVIIASVVVMLFLRMRSLKVFLRNFALPFLIPVVLFITPWAIRNYAVQGEVIILRSGFGYNLWRGNHPGATGTSRDFNYESVDSTLTPEYDEYITRNLPYEEQAREVFFKAEAVRYIKGNFAEYLTLTRKRLFYFLWRDPTHPMTGNALYIGGYAVLLLFAVAGFFIAAREKKLDPIIILIILGYLGMYVPIMIVPRYRIIMVVLFLLLGSVSVARIFPKQYSGKNLE